MTKILVTGGNGFIGRYVCDELAARGFEPLVLDRSVKPAPLREFETVLGDVRDDVHVTEAMAHADGWIHLAGVLGTQETIDDPRPAVLTNVIGGLNVLQAAKRYGLPGVNIGVGNFWMQNPYSISKHTVERFALMMANEAKLPVCTVRALNAYGPGQSVSAPFGSSKVRKIMPSFICRALRRMPIQVYGDGKQIMDMVYVADVAHVLVGALNGLLSGTVAPGDHFEAGTGRATTVLEIANTVLSLTSGDDIRFEDGGIEFLPMRRGEPPSEVVLGDPAMVENLCPDLKFASLEQVLPETIGYYRRYLADLK